MNKLTQEQLSEILKFGFDIDIKNCIKVSQDRICFYRNMNYDELLLSIHVALNYHNLKSETEGITICFMKNRDVHARQYPYYDGNLDDLVIVKNQRKLFEILLKK